MEERRTEQRSEGQGGGMVVTRTRRHPWRWREVDGLEIHFWGRTDQGGVGFDVGDKRRCDIKTPRFLGKCRCCALTWRRWRGEERCEGKI